MYAGRHRYLSRPVPLCQLLNAPYDSLCLRFRETATRTDHRWPCTNRSFLRYCLGDKPKLKLESYCTLSCVHNDFVLYLLLHTVDTTLDSTWVTRLKPSKKYFVIAIHFKANLSW